MESEKNPITAQVVILSEKTVDCKDLEENMSEDEGKIDLSKLKVNWRYLISLAVCLGLSTMNIGFTIAAGN